MNKQKIFAAIATPFAIVGLITALTVTSAGFAAEPTAPEGVPGTTSSSVGTKPQCSWTLSGVEATMALTSAGSELYSGIDLAIAGSDSDISASVSGTDCAWYGYKKGATITIDTAASPKFTISDALDTTMDFDLTTSAPMSLAITHACGPEFVDDDTASIGGASISAQPFSITKDATTTASTCTYAMSVGATVPAGKSPKNAGSSYVLVGPALTTTLTLVD
jgi:hypothetical protein